MAAHAIRFPPARRRRRWGRRLAGMVGTLALLGCAVAIGAMVRDQVRDDPPAAGVPAATATPAAAAMSGPTLTRAQKRARRAALQTLATQGYEPVRLADYRPRSELKVLVGRSDTGAMRAFFFVDGEFIAYDDPSSSSDLRVAKAGKTAVTLAYGLNAGGNQKVTFEWRDGTVQPTGPVPPVTTR